MTDPSWNTVLPLPPDRVDQMIACALSFPQERRRNASASFWARVQDFLFPLGSGFRREIVVMAMLVLVCLSLFAVPTGLSVSALDNEGSVSELHDLMIYDTIESAS